MHNESTHTEVHHLYNRSESRAQYNSFKRAYTDMGMEGEEMPKKKSSAGRHQACHKLLNGRGGQGGVSNEVAERSCNWKGKGQSTMDRYYADLPEVAPLAVLAGFESGGSGQYYIHRAHVEPSAELLDMLWPELPAKIEEVITLREKYGKSDKRRPSDEKLQFLKVMNWLRRTFLQDVPFLMKAHPDHPTWQKHDLFKSEKFKAWKEEVFEHVEKSHRSGQDRGVQVLAVLPWL